MVFRFSLKIFILLFVVATISDCEEKDNRDDSDNSKSGTWDVDNTPLPQFVEVNYIELNKIISISRYRSGEGHDYSDGSEDCRCMKHYFHPIDSLDWTAIKIVSPVAGTITRCYEEWAGTQIEIESIDYPAFRFTIFHVKLSSIKNIGDKVMAGEELGHHIGNQTWSDIAVWVNDPTHHGRLVSYFQVLNEDVLNKYKGRGISSIDDLIIPKAERDDHPLTCNGETFTSSETLQSWVMLSNP